MPVCVIENDRIDVICPSQTNLLLEKSQMSFMK
jgi:hypothetical protein